MRVIALGVLGLTLTSGQAFGASVLDLGMLPANGSVTGYSSPIGSWDATTRPRTTKFQVSEATRLGVNVFGYSNNYREVYDIWPERWRLQTDAATPEILFSGDKSTWSMSTYVKGWVVPVKLTGDPITQDTVAFSFTVPGFFELNSQSKDDTKDPDLLRTLGVTDVNRPDVLKWDITVTEATVSSVLPTMVLGRGNYEFLFEETLPYNGRYSDFSRGLTLTTSAVPIPAALWLFGSGLAGLGFIQGRNTRKDNHGKRGQVFH